MHGKATLNHAMVLVCGQIQLKFTDLLPIKIHWPASNQYSQTCFSLYKTIHTKTQSEDKVCQDMSDNSKIFQEIMRPVEHKPNWFLLPFTLPSVDRHVRKKNAHWICTSNICTSVLPSTTPTHGPCMYISSVLSLRVLNHFAGRPLQCVTMFSLFI